MKDLVENWNAFLSEDRDDLTYSQDTYNAFLLLALSNERGGNRDEVKNDIRAVPEVLTVTPVDRVDGGVQKQLEDYYLTTMKLRIRLPRGIDRDILTQQIVNDINTMRGVTVRRHTSEYGREVREEVDYQKSPGRARRLRKAFNRLTKTGPNKAGPFKAVTDDPDWTSAPPGAPGGLEEAQPKAVVTPGPPEEIEFKPEEDASMEELGIGDVDEKGWEINPPEIVNQPQDYRDPMTSTAVTTSDFGLRTRPAGVEGAGLPQRHRAVDTRAASAREAAIAADELAREAEYARSEQEWAGAGQAMDVPAGEIAAAQQSRQEKLKDIRGELSAPVNMQILAVHPETKGSITRRKKKGIGKGAGNYVVYRYVDENGQSHRGAMLHLDKLPTHLKPGRIFKSGALLGITAGSTGGSTGPHLHHQVRPETKAEVARLRRHGIRGDEKYGPGGKNISWKKLVAQKQKDIQARAEEATALAAQTAEAEEEAERLGYTREGMEKKLKEDCGPRKKLRIKIRPHGGKLITSFEVQSDLNSEVWDGDHLRPEIKERLREIAEEFIEKLDLPNVDIKDIILTGSLANYNWSDYSDLDVHIVIDFRDVADDERLVKKYFDAVRANWNRNHDIKLKGFEVELYVQDDDEKHTSTGVFSILNDEWVLKPSREQKEIDKLNIFKKARHVMRDIDKVEKHLDRKEYGVALALGQVTKDKIKRMRQTGLQKGGIYSTENLAFKVLRRGGYMGKLLNAVGTAYDAQKSLAEQE